MAAIAVVHVFISHFAIGGGLYLVVSEHLARRRNDLDRLRFVERLSRVFILITLVAGAVTGVAIWFVVGLLSPAATELLIHNFVWAWAIEWTFFAVEILAAILYFYGWRKLTPSAHLALGWVYFAAAWLSLAVINGILTFMLTPGGWLANGDFWAGFFNPGYWPSLVLRTGICAMLAGIYALLVASREGATAAKAALVRYNAWWALGGLAIAYLGYLWFFAAIPEEVRAAALARMPWPMLWHDRIGQLTAVLALAVVLAALFGRHLRTVGAALLMLLAFGWFGAYEMVREGMRKPWIVTGYLYGNGIAREETATAQQTGLLAAATYRTGQPGRDLFLHACRSCHTLDGYKALRRYYDGTDAAFIAGTIRGLHRMKGNMPPFPGTAAEADTLGQWLAERVDRRYLHDIHKLEGPALGERVYQVRCGGCHVPGGYQDMTASLAGLGASGIDDFLHTAGEVALEMPPFTGHDVDRKALVDHLVRLTEKGKP